MSARKKNNSVNKLCKMLEKTIISPVPIRLRIKF